MKKRDAILDSLSQVLSLPVTAVRVVELLQDDEAGVSEIARAIEYDQGVASNVLKMANAPGFAGSRPIGSIHEALVRLGTSRVLQLVLGTTISPLRKNEIHGYDLPPGVLWEHSVAAGVVVESLAAELKVQAPRYTYTSALLHDIGKLVLGNFVEVDVESICAFAYDQQVPFEMAEQEILGIDHAEVGALLLRSWNIPEEIIDAVRWHHEPEACPGRSSVVDLVHIADSLCLANGVGAGIDGLHYRISEEVVKRNGISSQIAERITVSMLGELDKIRDLVGN